ncbi:MAG: hypothetical protein EDM05_003740 [Leptolyngbya sp. IPPAS B-1204]|nr:hypothetical protein [Elainella sp. C42_A2020_010]RNJ66396.1 MAG: hypothetical protein EDM05_26030 [Leptolyngbya sp. IPPAS B-1204]
MKHQNNWQPIIAITVLLPLGLPDFSQSDAIANTAIASAISSYSSQFLAQESLSQLQPKVQPSQTPSTCCQVAVENRIYVREESTVYSESIGILNPGQNVVIASGNTVSQISILAPTEDYIWTDWFTIKPFGTKIRYPFQL